MPKAVRSRGSKPAGADRRRSLPNTKANFTDSGHTIVVEPDLLPYSLQKPPPGLNLVEFNGGTFRASRRRFYMLYDADALKKGHVANLSALYINQGLSGELMIDRTDCSILYGPMYIRNRKGLLQAEDLRVVQQCILRSMNSDLDLGQAIEQAKKTIMHCVGLA